MIVEVWLPPKRKKLQETRLSDAEDNMVIARGERGRALGGKRRDEEV